VCSVCTQPLILPVNQNPLAAFLQHQAPTAKFTGSKAFLEKISVLAVTIILAVPEITSASLLHPPIGTDYPEADSMSESSIAASYGMHATPVI